MTARWPASESRPVAAAPPPAAPLFIGPRNAEHLCGVPWRWARDHAKAWGVPVLRVDGKAVIPAAAFAEALAAHAEKAPRAEVDELEALRRRLGKRRLA